ncbi:MAG: aldo/keto reductase, partial [Bacteroidetes bacterium]
MEYRKFGNTDLTVSAVGFGAWAIGGPSMAGDIPIGWGSTDDAESLAAIRRSLDLGVNFFDTANFYGLGHSENLLGKTIGPKQDILIATKVGHRLNEKNEIFLDYSKAHILEACTESLRRLGRDHIDFYQLHTARLADLERGECVEAMELLKQQGKIRYWGLSLNTFDP